MLSSESIVDVKVPFLMSTLPTAILVELVRVNATLELVTELPPSVILPFVPLAVSTFVVPSAPSNKIPDVMVEKSSGPLLAVTSAPDPSTSGPSTLVNVTVVAAATSPWNAKSSIFAL